MAHPRVLLIWKFPPPGCFVAFGQLKENFELRFIVPKARQVMTKGHCLMQLWAWGYCKPLAGPGQSLVGVFITLGRLKPQMNLQNSLHAQRPMPKNRPEIFSRTSNVSVNSKPDHLPPPPPSRAIPGDSHVLIARGVGFSPNFLCPGAHSKFWGVVRVGGQGWR